MKKVLRVEVRQNGTMWQEDCESFAEFLEVISENPNNAEKNNVNVWAVVFESGYKKQNDFDEEFDTEFIGEFDYWLEDGELYTASELNEDQCDEVLTDIRNYFEV